MRKSLPHYSQINTYQFVTFRTKASVDDLLLRLKSENLNEPLKQQKIDDYLDKSKQGSLLNAGIIELVIQYCGELEPDFYQLFCVAVMPNHVHILFKQKQEISVIMKKLKGGLAFKINKRLRLTGTLWDKGYFDKAIRDERHFQLTYQYIKNNPIKAELTDADARFYGVYD